MRWFLIPVIPEKYRYLAIPAIILIVLAGCKKEIRYETEPNNSFQTATPLSLDESISGYMNTDDDIDYYRVNVSIPSIVTVELSAVKGINHAIRIWHEDGTPVPVKLVDDNRKSSAERIANFRMDPGLWYIAIEYGERDEKKGNSVTSYTLTTISRSPLMEEKEPNDIRDNATPIMTGEEIRGYYSPAVNRLNETGEVPVREEDWYRLTFPEDGDPLQILTITLDGIPGVNGVLYVYAPDGTLQMVADSGDTGQGERIEGMAVQRGAYCYIMICSRNFTSSPSYYTLRTEAGPWTADLEREPNNSRENATPMSESTMRGRINGPGDSDWFSIAGENGSVARYDLQVTDGADLRLALYSQDGTLLGTSDSRRNGGTAIIPLVPSGNDIFVNVSGRDQASAKGEYTLTRTMTAVDGNIQIEHESNDSRKAAQIINSSRIMGAVNKNSDRDFYQLEYKERKNVILRLATPQAGTIRISVTDPQGFILRSMEGGDGKELVLKELIERKGYILIEAQGASPGSIYTLSVEVVQ